MQNPVQVRAVEGSAQAMHTQSQRRLQNANARSDIPSSPPLPRWVHFMSGGVGGCIAATVTCPLEVVKTRMQSSLYLYNQASLSTLALKPSISPAGTTIGGNLPHNNGTTASLTARRGLFAFSQTAVALRETAKSEGISGLWRGLGPMLLGIVPARAIYFLVYSHLKPRIGLALGLDQTNSLTHLSASACAALCKLCICIF